MLQVPDRRLQRLPALEPLALLLAQALELAPLDDLHARVGRIHVSEAQVHNHLPGLVGSGVLRQDRRLLQLLI